MTRMVETRNAGVIVGKLDHGADLLESLTQVCADRGVCLGRIEALGAVQAARLAYYDQVAKNYEFFEITGAREIAALVGNVSLREGKPIIHAHVTLTDESGHAVGGHLAPGTIVFACEFTIQILEGATLTRGHDAVTGLPLWVMD